MASCRRCGIEIEAAGDLDQDFCEACIEDFIDEEDADDGAACVDEYGVPSLDWMPDERG